MIYAALSRWRFSFNMQKVDGTMARAPIRNQLSAIVVISLLGRACDVRQESVEQVVGGSNDSLDPRRRIYRPGSY